MSGFFVFIAYYIIGASLLLLIHKVFSIPRELFRKMLHMVCVLSIFVLLYAFDTWYWAACSALLFALLIYPVIGFLERYPRFMEILVERKSGEIRSSLMLVFFMMALMIAVFWGIFGPGRKVVIAAAVMAWGLGDAAAALVGKALGKHPIHHPRVEGPKTLEGTLAMGIVSACAVFITLLCYGILPWYFSFIVACLVAPICALTELYSRNGIDTFTVPLAAGLPICLLIELFIRLAI